MLIRLSGICAEFTNSGAEQTRAVEHLNAEREQIEAELAARDADYLLKSSTFPTVADRSPNRYSLPTDLGKFRYVERVITESTADYARLLPVQILSEKEVSITGSNGFPVMISTGSTGPPQGYLLGLDFVQLFPISDAVHTIRIWYLGRYADIVADDTELDIPEVLNDSIVFGVRIRIHDYLHFPTGGFKAELAIKKEKAFQSLMSRVSDGPLFGNAAIPPSDWW